MSSPLSLLLSRPYGMVGAALIGVFVLIGVLGPALSPYDPNETHPTDRLLAPGAKSRSGNSYLLGTDYLGRDTLSRALAAPRVYLWIGLIAVSAGATPGLLGRVIFGHRHGNLSQGIEGIFRFLATPPIVAFPLVPGEIIVIFIMILVGPGYWAVVMVSGLVASMRLAPAFYFSLASLGRGQGPAYADAGPESRGGTADPVIFFQHLGAGFALAVGMAVVLEAIPSFLGLRVQPPQPSLGRMLSIEGRMFLEATPTLALVPGVIIVVGVAGYLLLAQSLREAYDRVQAGRP